VGQLSASKSQNLDRYNIDYQDEYFAVQIRLTQLRECFGDVLENFSPKSYLRLVAAYDQGEFLGKRMS
jgi:hypothetical protein